MKTTTSNIQYVKRYNYILSYFINITSVCGETVETAKLSELQIILNVHFSMKLETSTGLAQGVKAQIFKTLLTKFFLWLPSEQHVG